MKHKKDKSFRKKKHKTTKDLFLDFFKKMIEGPEHFSNNFNV